VAGAVVAEAGAVVAEAGAEVKCDEYNQKILAMYIYY